MDEPESSVTRRGAVRILMSIGGTGGAALATDWHMPFSKVSSSSPAIASPAPSPASDDRTMQAVIDSGAQTVPDMNELSRLAPDPGRTVFVSDDSHGGFFSFQGGDQRAKIAGDPAGGFFKAPNANPSGQAGAWVRRYTSGRVSPHFFGNSLTGTGEGDDILALERAAKAAVEYEEILDLGHAYGRQVYGVSRTLEVPGVVAVEGTGFGCKIRALRGFPATYTFTGAAGTESAPSAARYTIPAPVMLMQAGGRDNQGRGGGSFRISGNGFAPVGLVVLGSAADGYSLIRVDTTTKYGAVFVGCQNFALGKIQLYMTGESGAVFLNGCYNGMISGLDIRKNYKSNFLSTDDPSWPYFKYFNNISGASECLFLKGIFEDNIGTNKENIVRFETGSRNVFMRTQLYGRANVGIFESDKVTHNSYQSCTLFNGGVSGKAAEFHSYNSEIIGGDIGLWGSESGALNSQNLIECFNTTIFDRVNFPKNNHFSAKLIANLSKNPNDARIVQFTPRFHCLNDAEFINSYAGKIDAIMSYFSLNSRKLVTHDYRDAL